MAHLTTCQWIFISISSPPKLYFIHSYPRIFSPPSILPSCFSSRHRGPRVGAGREGRRGERREHFSRGNFIVRLLITASEDRVGNHLIYFVRYLPDPSPYNKYMTCYCMKFIFKGYNLILEQPCLLILKTFSSTSLRSHPLCLVSSI